MIKHLEALENKHIDGIILNLLSKEQEVLESYQCTVTA